VAFVLFEISLHGSDEAIALRATNSTNLTNCSRPGRACCHLPSMLSVFSASCQAILGGMIDSLPNSRSVCIG
jgi:hypothetical protein